MNVKNSEMLFYLFHGPCCSTCTAIFSSLEMAHDWIRKHSLSGIVIQYTINKPAYDLGLKTQTLPEYLLENIGDSHGIETYTDYSRHWKFCYGYCEDEPDYDEARRRWYLEHAKTKQ